MFGTYLLGWVQRAARDGVITQDEVLELVTEALRVFEVDVRIEVPAPPGINQELKR